MLNRLAHKDKVIRTSTDKTVQNNNNELTVVDRTDSADTTQADGNSSSSSGPAKFNTAKKSDAKKKVTTILLDETTENSKPTDNERQLKHRRSTPKPLKKLSKPAPKIIMISDDDGLEAEQDLPTARTQKPKKPKKLKSGPATNYEYLVKNVEDKRSVHQAEGGYSARTAIRNLYSSKEGKNGIINKEFETICSVIVPEQQAFEAAPSIKNRYHDIPCLDSTRVPLKNCPTGHDYIHANYVDGYKQSGAYICCQGPKKETAEDFWHMVWQEKVFVIAMLTKCLEGNKVKCIQYWPEQKSESLFGIYRIRCRTNKSYKGFDYTELLLSHQTDNYTEVRPIVHILFFSWPDYGIPADGKQFLTFTQLVRKTQKSFVSKLSNIDTATTHPLGPPIVVHCSAGVGRTGTFCAVDICCRKLYDTKRVDVAETVRLLRSQRAKSVQTIEQYLFVYLCVVCFAAQIGQLEPIKEESDALSGAIKSAIDMYQHKV